MAYPRENTRWESRFDDAVALAADGRVAETVSRLKRLRAWQHRQPHWGTADSEWHSAEILWLHGVVLEHAQQSDDARAVWQRLARLYMGIAAGGHFVQQPPCRRCAERRLEFAPSWMDVAVQLRGLKDGAAALVDAFRLCALGRTPGNIQPTPRLASSPSADANVAAAPAPPADVPISRGKLRARREVIRRTFQELERPATLVQLCEDYLKLDALDCIVWCWYGAGLTRLGNYADAETALHTARGLATTNGMLAFVAQRKGILADQRGQFPEAAACFREAIGYNESVEFSSIMLGRVLVRLGEPAEAEDCFRKAVAFDDSHVITALLELAMVLRARSALFEARRVLKQALAIDGDDDVRECLADVERVIRLQAKSAKPGE